MTFLDSWLPDLVSTLSAGNILGAGATAAAIISTGYDPLTGEDTESSASEELNVFPPDKYNVNEVDGSRVKIGDMKLMIPAVNWEALDDSFGNEPSTNQRINIQGRDYAIIDVNPTASGEEIAVFELQLRG